VLFHQADPAALIRAAAAHVHSGGVIAFHEFAICDETQMLSPIPIYQSCLKWITAAFMSVMMHPEAARQMPALFEKAGCGRPTMFCEAIVSGAPDSLFYPWVALTVQSLMPQIVKIGAATAAEVDVETLESRLRDAMRGTGHTLSPLQYCGWVRI
jgi:hypothetical protein